MVVCAIAFVGKYNEPLFFHAEKSSKCGYFVDCDEESECRHIEGIIHASLDLIEEKKAKRTAPGSDMFLGALFVIEEYKVFAFYSNAHIKTIVVADVATTEVSVREFLTHLHNAYVSASLNPFHPVGEPVTSQKLRAKVRQMVRIFNGA